MQHICNKYAYNIQTLCQDLKFSSYGFICHLDTEICLQYVPTYKVYADICRQKCAYRMQKYADVHIVCRHMHSLRRNMNYICNILLFILSLVKLPMSYFYLFSFLLSFFLKQRLYKILSFIFQVK